MLAAPMATQFNHMAAWMPVLSEQLHGYATAGGKGVLIQELNSKDAFVAAPGGAAITVESLAGTCVLSAGGPAPYRAVRPAPPQGVEAHLSGRVGQVMLLSHGGPIKLYLPHTAGKADAHGPHSCLMLDARIILVDCLAVVVSNHVGSSAAHTMSIALPLRVPSHRTLGFLERGDVREFLAGQSTHWLRLDVCSGMQGKP